MAVFSNMKINRLGLLDFYDIKQMHCGRVDVGNFGHFWTTPILQPVHIADVALVADAIHDRNRVIPSCPNMEVIFA